MNEIDKALTDLFDTLHGKNSTKSYSCYHCGKILHIRIPKKALEIEFTRKFRSEGWKEYRGDFYCENCFETRAEWQEAQRRFFRGSLN